MLPDCSKNLNIWSGMNTGLNRCVFGSMQTTILPEGLYSLLTTHIPRNHPRNGEIRTGQYSSAKAMMASGPNT